MDKDIKAKSNNSQGVASTDKVGATSKADSQNKKRSYNKTGKYSSNGFKKDVTNVDKVAEKKVVKPSTNIDYPNDTAIPCTSVVVGGLYLIGKKTGELYVWENRGDVTYVEWQDLKALKLVHSQFLYDPLIVIEDENILAEWADVAQIYESNISDEEIYQLFNGNPNNIKRELRLLPKSIKNAVANIATNAAKTGRLTRIDIMKVFDEILGTNLMLEINGRAMEKSAEYDDNVKSKSVAR